MADLFRPPSDAGPVRPGLLLLDMATLSDVSALPVHTWTATRIVSTWRSCRAWAPLSSSFWPLVRGERILDVGCGEGTLTQQIVDRGAAVVGIDSSQEMVDARGLAVSTRGSWARRHSPSSTSSTGCFECGAALGSKSRCPPRRGGEGAAARWPIRRRVRRPRQRRGYRGRDRRRACAARASAAHPPLLPGRRRIPGEAHRARIDRPADCPHPVADPAADGHTGLAWIFERATLYRLGADREPAVTKSRSDCVPCCAKETAAGGPTTSPAIQAQ